MADAFPGDLPKGTIIAWYNKSGAAVPHGWVLCDGNNGTPDLTNRFLRGVTIASQVGAGGGRETHSHGIGKGNPDGNGFQGEGGQCKTVNVSTENHLPPFVNVQYIMKT